MAALQCCGWPQPCWAQLRRNCTLRMLALMFTSLHAVYQPSAYAQGKPALVSPKPYGFGRHPQHCLMFAKASADSSTGLQPRGCVLAQLCKTACGGLPWQGVALQLMNQTGNCHVLTLLIYPNRKVPYR